jgi:hypothetical protein
MLTTQTIGRRNHFNFGLLIASKSSAANLTINDYFLATLRTVPEGQILTA